MVRSRRLALLCLGVALFAGLSAPAQPTSTVAVEPGPESVAPTSGGPSASKTAATSASATAPKAPAVGRGSLLRTLTRDNPMIWMLGLCSIVTLGFGLERLVALRRERVMPRDFVTRFLERLSTGKLDRDRAAELCRANESAAARVFAMVVSYWGQPAATIRQALGYDAAGEVSELKRNVRVLNGTATLAPLLGLLGTVIGMIQSFDSLGGRVGPAKGEALAQGISLALVSTALGLAIAIVSVVAYYYLLNRVDVLVHDLDDHARRVIDLVCAEAIRPSPTADRRSGIAPPGDLSRHESRVH